MKVCITTTGIDVSDHVYDLLSDPLSGHDCLHGSKECLDDHIMVPDIIEYDLTPEEIEKVKEIPGVLSVETSIGSIPELHYSKVVTPPACCRLANYTYSMTSGFTSSFNLAPAALYYTVNSDLSFTQNTPATNTTPVEMSSVDCSNVDIIVMDSGVDPSCEDLKDIYGNNLVRLFDWSVLTDTTGVNILSSTINPYTGSAYFVDINYYVDYVGHGTSCASTVAGFKCGMAKNATIYSLNVYELDAPFGFDQYTCFKLLLGFQHAKKQNLFGLLSSRPTIVSASFGQVGPIISGVISGLYHDTAGTNLKTTMLPVGPISNNPSLSTISGLVATTIPAPTPMYNNFINGDGSNNDGLLSASISNGGTSAYGNTAYVTSIPYTFSWATTANTVLNASGLAFLQNRLPGYDATIDAYVRQLPLSGIHFVTSAGNLNAQLTRTAPTQISYLLFRNLFDNSSYLVPRQFTLGNAGTYVDNSTLYAVNSTYYFYDFSRFSAATGQLGAGSTSIPYRYIGVVSTAYTNYCSPDIGPNQSSITYPIIKVGCVTPLGNADVANNTFDSGGFSRAIYNTLQAPWGINYNGIVAIGDTYGGQAFPNGYGIYCNPLGDFTNIRNTNPYSPMFVKTPYSNFGSAVDIYAPGSANWSAVSNQTVYSDDGVNYFYSVLTGRISAANLPPFFRDSQTTLGSGYYGKYVFANGTSSACPLVAGCLATFLADNPKSTPLDAKNWLISNSLKNSIMKTASGTAVSTAVGTNATRGRYGYTNDGINSVSLQLAQPQYFGTYVNNYGVGQQTMALGGGVTLRNSTRTVPSLSAFYDYKDKVGSFGPIYDVLFGCRFFTNDNNRVVQAFPLRNSVYYANKSDNYANQLFLSGGQTKYSTVLELAAATSDIVTHDPSEYVTY